MHERHKVDLRALSHFVSPISNQLSFSRPVMLQTAAAALSSLATLSLSGSPPPQGIPHTGTTLASASGFLSSASPAPVPKIEERDDDVVLNEAAPAAPTKAEINGTGVSVTKVGKKRGTIFKCESCSKVSTVVSFLYTMMSSRLQYANFAPSGTLCTVIDRGADIYLGLPAPFMPDQTPLGTLPALA